MAVSNVICLCKVLGVPLYPKTHQKPLKKEQKLKKCNFQNLIKHLSMKNIKQIFGHIVFLLA